MPSQTGVACSFVVSAYQADEIFRLRYCKKLVADMMSFIKKPVFLSERG
jgi:hypothetical protein